ncbi:MAG: hypothetical protein QXU74_01095 [Candidatus Aenigmatarchaeota archaeon]
MEKSKPVFWIFSLLFVFGVFLYTYQPLGENFYIIGDLFVIVLSFLAFSFGLYAYTLHGFKSLSGKAFFFLSLGVFLWFLGETTWGIYEIVLGIRAPVASMADAFWLLGYPCFLVGLAYILKIAQFPIKKPKILLSIFLFLFIFSFLIYSIMSTITSPEISIWEKFSTAGYVIGDMLLLSCITFATINLFGTKTFHSYFLIILGLACMTTADIYYMNFLEIYEVGNLIDLFWDLGYILLSLGFFYYRKTMKALLKK